MHIAMPTFAFTDPCRYGKRRALALCPQNKEKEAREEMKRKMKELEQQRRDEKRGRGKGAVLFP